MLKRCIFILTVFAAIANVDLLAAPQKNIQDLHQLIGVNIQPQDLKAYLQKNAPGLAQFVGSTPTWLDVKLYTTLAQSSHPVIIKFYLNGCGPCKQMGRTVENVAKEFGDSILVINVELTDTTRYLMQAFRANGVPTLVFFKDGKKVEQFTGTLTAAELTSKINTLLN